MIEERKSILPGTQDAAASTNPQKSDGEITIEDFNKLSLRVAKILAVDKIPKSNKLLKITVSLGAEERQVVAGIAKHYQPEELIGRKVVVVSNLKEAKLMGEVSQGMILAASDDDGKLTILTVSEDISEGSIVK